MACLIKAQLHFCIGQNIVSVEASEIHSWGESVPLPCFLFIPLPSDAAFPLPSELLSFLSYRHRCSLHWPSER